MVNGGRSHGIIFCNACKGYTESSWFGSMSQEGKGTARAEEGIWEMDFASLDGHRSGRQPPWVTGGRGCRQKDASVVARMIVQVMVDGVSKDAGNE